MRLEKFGGYWREGTNPYTSGVTTTVGWNRLIESLRNEGILKADEDVIELDIANDGVRLTLEKRT